MNYEKAYKEALERAKEQLDGAKVFDYDNEQIAYDIRTTVYSIFSELKMSKDESVKKAITHILYENYTDAAVIEGVEIAEIVAWLEKQGEPQPYKGNGDTMRKNLIRAFKSVGGKYWGGFDVRDIIYFLESKDAIELEKQSEQNPAWSEEDELMLTSTVNTLKLTNGAAQMKIDWLKSIKNRVQPQQKQEWSISDERILNNIFTYLGYAKDGNKYCTPELICEAENWLKFLKPQPHWKPTDEQMQSLNFAIVTYSKKDDYKLTYDSLNSLYNDLKKL